MLIKNHEYITIQTKRPINFMMKYADYYTFNNEVALPHQYYFDTDKWEHECKTETSRFRQEQEYLVMDCPSEGSHFSVLLRDGSCQMFYITTS